MSNLPYAEAITLGDLLRKTASERPEAEALIVGADRLTYEELLTRVEQLSRAMMARGIVAGDHIGILGPNSSTYLALVLASTSIGAVAVPINARFKATELDFVIGHADIKLLFTSDEISEHTDYPEMLEKLMRQPGDDSNSAGVGTIFAAAPALEGIVLRGAPRDNFIRFDEFLAEADNITPKELDIIRSRVQLSDAAILMYTSGTTSQPKGCLLTHESVSRNGRNFAFSKFDMSPSTRIWDPLPFFHMSVILPFTASLHAGSTFIAMPHFDAASALNVLENEQATIAYAGFETIWQSILIQPDFAQRDLSAIQTVMCVGTPERLRKMQITLPNASIVAAFGSTEGSGTACYNHPNDPLEDRMTTAGTPFPGAQVKVIGPEGDDLGPGEQGELCFKGYIVFKGYYKDPVSTLESMTDDGWFRTGDLGTIDERGQVAYLGRIKDMLKVGGENVAAVEIEDFLATNPAVQVVAVVAAPDPTYAEVPAAYIQLVPGSRLSREEVIHYCLGKIASYKVPRYVRFIEDWPMSGTKIKKFELRNWICEEIESGVHQDSTRA